MKAAAPRDYSYQCSLPRRVFFPTRGRALARRAASQALPPDPGSPATREGATGGALEAAEVLIRWGADRGTAEAVGAHRVRLPRLRVCHPEHLAFHDNLSTTTLAGTRQRLQSPRRVEAEVLMRAIDFQIFESRFVSKKKVLRKRLKRIKTLNDSILRNEAIFITFEDEYAQVELLTSSRCGRNS